MMAVHQARMFSKRRRSGKGIVVTMACDDCEWKLITDNPEVSMILVFAHCHSGGTAKEPWELKEWLQHHVSPVIEILPDREGSA